MKWVLVILAAVAVAQGLDDGLRVTWGINLLGVGRSNFFNMPRTIPAAVEDGWVLTDNPPGVMLELVMYCLPERTLCFYYDRNGFVAGIQVAFLQEDFTTVYRPEDKFVLWVAPPESFNEPPKRYYTITQYFANEEALRTGSRDPNGETLQDDGVYVRALDGSTMKIPLREEEIVSETAFTLQNCIPFMGTHYFYNFTSELDCNELYPWFTLVRDGQLIGTGVQVVGTLNNQPRYFENPPTSKTGLSVIVPRAPDCLFDWTEEYGIFTIHIYYVNNPWRMLLC